MSLLETLLTGYIVAVVVAGAFPALFFLLRLRKTTWRGSDVGRALMTKARAVTVLFWTSLAVFALSFLLPLMWQLVVQAIADTYITVAVTKQWLVIRKAQRLDEHNGPKMRDLHF